MLNNGIINSKDTFENPFEDINANVLEPKKIVDIGVALLHKDYCLISMNINFELVKFQLYFRDLGDRVKQQF